MSGDNWAILYEALERGRDESTRLQEKRNELKRYLPPVRLVPDEEDEGRKKKNLKTGGGTRGWKKKDNGE